MNIKGVKGYSLGTVVHPGEATRGGMSADMSDDFSLCAGENLERRGCNLVVGSGKLLFGDGKVIIRG